MNDQLSKLSIGLLGFVAGVAFLISCGGGGDTGVSLPINDADANAPQINDQMFCSAKSLDMVDETSVADTLTCMNQSNKVRQTYKSLAEVYAEGWIMVQIAGTSNVTAVTLLFYK